MLDYLANLCSDFQNAMKQKQYLEMNVHNTMH